MKKVLITGATGFIGRHCLPLLVSNGYEVHAVSSRIPPQDLQQSSPEVHWHQSDLLDKDQAAALMSQVQPTHLLHFAWFVTPGIYWTSTENFRWVQSSLGLLQNFAQHGGERVVMAGSCTEYDWKDGCYIEQLTPLIPATVYGTCKHALQMMLHPFAAQTGLSAAWGRIFFLYGPHEHPSRLVASVVRSVLQDEPALCTHGNQIRDFLYVQDVADAFVTLLGSNVSGAVNIGSGQPVALKELIWQIAEKANRRELIKLGARTAPVNEPNLLVADTNRLTNEVGWLPKYSHDKGLEQTMEWWKNNIGRTA